MESREESMNGKGILFRKREKSRRGEERGKNY